MAGSTGSPRDRVSEWLDHAAVEGAATMMPEVAFPGMVLGFTIRAGTEKQCTALVILFLNIPFLGRGLLILCSPSPPPYHPLKNEYKLKYK